MRHYERVNYRHLNDSERYRDYEYLGDDAWIGPNEHVLAQTETNGGQLRSERERDDRDAFERNYQRMGELTHHLEYPRARFMRDEPPRAERPTTQRRPAQGRQASGLREMREVIRNPGGFVRRMVSGIFHGKGPKNWMRSDTRIHDEVCEMLARDAHVDASHIEVVVKDGEVTLGGRVPDRRSKRRAEQVLDDVLGVRDVHNRLTVG
jgi:hypothetical protein